MHCSSIFSYFLEKCVDAFALEPLAKIFESEVICKRQNDVLIKTKQIKKITINNPK
jgi:hypothetical protein